MNVLKQRLLLLMLCGSFAVQAQLTDSIAVNQNTFYRPFETALWETPLFYTSQQLHDYTQTQLDFRQADRHFKRVQTAAKTSEIRFLTKGIFNIQPRLRLFGDFEFRNTTEQELGYNLSTERTEYQNVLSPNYFFAPKKGDWKIQHYTLDGGFTYAFRNGLLLGATAVYRTGKHYRIVDPRPEIVAARYGATLHGGYVLGKHRIFAAAGMGKNTETATIMYVQDAQNAPAYPETFTRFSSGYGRVLFNSSFNSYIYNTIDRNLATGYQFQNARNSLSVRYKYDKSLQDFYRKNAEGQVLIDDAQIAYRYRVVTHKTAAQYFHDGAQRDYNVQLSYEQQQGDNFSVAEDGQNFRKNLDRASLTAGIIHKQQQRVAYAAEFGIVYSKHAYIDLLGSTDKRLNTIETQLSVNRDVWANAANRLNIEVQGSYYFATDQNLSFVPAASNTSFADNVIFPDHAYDVTAKCVPRMAVHYYISLPKTKTLRIFADYSANIAVGDRYLSYYNNLDTKSSSIFNMGIAINY